MHSSWFGHPDNTWRAVWLADPWLRLLDASFWLLALEFNPGRLLVTSVVSKVVLDQVSLRGSWVLFCFNRFRLDEKLKDSGLKGGKCYTNKTFSSIQHEYNFARLMSVPKFRKIYYIHLGTIKGFWQNLVLFCIETLGPHFVLVLYIKL
jgi:hypothetical protein